MAPAKPKPEPLRPARRGRPPKPARTSLGRFMQARGITANQLVDAMSAAAPRCGVSRDHIPTPTLLRDYVTGRHAPPLPVILLVRFATGGNIDLDHWVRDLYE